MKKPKPEIPLKRTIEYFKGTPCVTACNCPDRERCSICDTYEFCTFQPPPTIPLWAIGIMVVVTALAIYFSNLILF